MSGGVRVDVLVVDDHELLAEALCIALRAEGIDAGRLAPRPSAELTAAVLDRAPDLVLLDLDLGRFGDSTPVIGALADAGVRVVVVTGTTDRMAIAAALEAGALGYAAKSDGFDTLVRTATEARTATGPLDPAGHLALLSELRRSRSTRARTLAPFTLLTDREQATLRAVAEGSTVPEIAAAWVVSEATVRTHVRGVLGKLDVKSQLAAVGLALRSGWLADRNDRAAV